MAQNPRNAAGQAGTILRNDLNHFSSYWGLTISIPLERRGKRRVLLVGLTDLPLIFWRGESVEPPDFLRLGERLHRQIRMWAPKSGAEAGGLLLDLPICIFTIGYQRLASHQKYRRRHWYRLHHGECQQKCDRDWHRSNSLSWWRLPRIPIAIDATVVR